MRPWIALCGILTFPAAIHAQTQIGSWKFQEAMLSPTPGVYFISSSRGDPNSDFYTSFDIYCDRNVFTLHIMLPASSRLGPKVPKEGWTVSLHFGDEFVGELHGRSEDSEAIVSPIPGKILKAIVQSPEPATTRALTVGIERADLKDVARVFSYPAVDTRQAIGALAAACR